ncbi:ciliogenesis-associated TTC17-interacting protein [Scaptodrosophila lebanonensis]|uniref:Ciliogenesis-associated TTC17-interacting protein n=1 Tax=Drosophila lebanonensis TaxID=7225 RepID=A0A6J2TKB4_DROLE|nr:ciliogenesis-associated TTC17-interacting protein [Scaptodrosophila lebanonensis]
MDTKSFCEPVTLNPPLFLPLDGEGVAEPYKNPSETDSSELPDKLSAQDEISISSIISALLRPIEPSSEEFHRCHWEINPKQFLHVKRAIIFKEQLYISKLRNTNCKLSENIKVFFERELEQVGKFCVNVEEALDGYVVHSSSKMRKGKGFTECGHQLQGKYDDKFVLICEKRTEFDRVDHARVEKSLELRNHDDLLITAVRETKINEESQKFKSTIDIKDRDHVFVLDGGIMLLMRHLICNNFVGNYEYYTMNLFGRVLRCNLVVRKERKLVRIFHRTYKFAVHIINQQCFNDELQDVAETFMTPEGHIIMHFWRGYNYLLHSACGPIKPKEPKSPKLELMWRQDLKLAKQFKNLRPLSYENATKYLAQHPELADLMQDYVLNLLRYKPSNVLQFSLMFFNQMAKN